MSAEDLKRVKQEKLDRLLRHIKLVQEACELLGKKIIDRGEKGDEQLGRMLIALGQIHDNSKFYGIEWDYLHADAEKDQFQLAAAQHITTNSHHPEYWGDADQMPRIAIAEMVCDWYARSQEFGTDLRNWIMDKALSKYHIRKSGKTYKTIKEFLDLLLEKSFS